MAEVTGQNFWERDGRPKVTVLQGENAGHAGVVVEEYPEYLIIQFHPYELPRKVWKRDTLEYNTERPTNKKPQKRPSTQEEDLEEIYNLLPSLEHDIIKSIYEENQSKEATIHQLLQIITEPLDFQWHQEKKQQEEAQLRQREQEDQRRQRKQEEEASLAFASALQFELYNTEHTEFYGMQSPRPRVVVNCSGPLGQDMGYPDDIILENRNEPIPFPRHDIVPPMRPARIQRPVQRRYQHAPLNTDADTRARNHGRVSDNAFDQNQSYEDLLELADVVVSLSPEELATYPEFTCTTIADDQSTCAICLERFLLGCRVKSTECAHLFHADCFNECFSTRKKCPVCSTELGR